MARLILPLLFFISSISFAQFPGFWESKEFSKEVSLFRAKTYLISEVLETNEKSVPFEAIPLAASSSGELTTLLYKCDVQSNEGLILGFYGNYWDKTSGVSYQGYAFKNLSKEKAYEFFNKIEAEVEANKKFLKENFDNNNIVFAYDDLKVMIWGTLGGYYLMRVYWNGFDSTWEKTSYERSKRRFEKKM